MAPSTSTGPGRAQRKGRSAGRTTVKGTVPRAGTRPGRSRPAEESGRYTPPVPRSVRRSPRWFGTAMLALLVLGVLMILLNYLSVLPGSVSVWYLVGGLGLIFAGFLMATRYR
ncbi:MAG TPA: cell division protein CrgA [Acidimicrobiales bacterium]|nr:cell division protein CrgA [Acidimicrobiales bacterium]